MDNSLYHHGIKGQRWGVRRFQNKDGSLTTAGKSRQYKHDAKQFKREYRRSKLRRLISSNKNYENSARALKGVVNEVAEDRAMLFKTAASRGKQIAEKRLDDVAGAMIKDIGVTDTTAARDAVKQILIDEGYYRMFD